ncbi:unnamed protein product [Rotaria sordida]|uniref:Uncharacterized protein n=1 Tax=Rotaria sordida TaxID=392033 RepID=A0A814TWG7_9BILA|nr:unnamed protein product [Rotaria sordida]
MQYNNVDTSLSDAIMLIDQDNNQLSSSSSLQQNTVLQKKLIRLYRIALAILLVLLLICLIILFVTFLHKNQYHHIINPPVSLQLSACNDMNGTSINNNNKVNWLHLNKQQLIAALSQFKIIQRSRTT